MLIVGSGNVVHNLRRIDCGRPHAAFRWARAFDTDVAGVMTDDPAVLARLQDHGDYPMAAPTPDHFIPLLHLAGLASAAGEAAHVLVDGHAMGSLSMTCYTLGCGPLEAGGQGGAPVLPEVPADETNL